MRARSTQYRNEIVSLTVLALMVLALAAGQVRSDTRDALALGEAVGNDDNGVISLEVSFRRKGE
jgi:hypothetical protein